MAYSLSLFRALPLVAGCFLLSTHGSPISCEDDPESGFPTDWEPRTPEQTLYAYVRCLNDSSASVEQKISWVKWQPDTSPESQCYVKCVSQELRLYDPETKQFRPERFVQQAAAFLPRQLNALTADAHPMLAGVLEDNSCESVFSKYSPFYTAHHSTILRMFHGDYRDIGRTYAQLGDRVKQIGQTQQSFCEKQAGVTQWSVLDQGCPPLVLLECIAKGFRWITEEGAVNVNEIRRDYEAAGLGAADMGDYCESATGSARKLYNCLRDKGADSLATVIAERNQRTAFYFDLTSQEEPWRSAVEYANSL